jgi:hypothetical protein
MQGPNCTYEKITWLSTMPLSPNMCGQLANIRKLEKEPCNARYDACHEYRKKKVSSLGGCMFTNVIENNSWM